MLFGTRAAPMVSLRCRPRQPRTFASRTRLPGDRSLVRPGFAAPECKIVGVRGWSARLLLGLDHLIGNTLALAIGDSLFLGVESQRELLVHVAGTGPAHQRLDFASLLRLIVELPLLCLGSPGLHGVFRRLKYAGSHGSNPVRMRGMEARGRSGRNGIETAFGFSDSQQW